FQLELLPKDRRREEAAFWCDFDQARPGLVGAMLDALSAAMRIYPSVRLSGLPRMADFCRWGVAVAEVLGLGGAQFLEAYHASIGSQNDTALQSHPVAAALLAMLRTTHGDLADVAAQTELWCGTPSELLDALAQAAEAERIDLKAKGWPKAANA